MIKFLRYSCIGIVVLFSVSAIIGKNFIYHTDYQKFISTVRYFSIPSAEIYNNKKFIKIKSVLIDDKKISNINELIENSDYVLRIKIEKDAIIYGYGIINQVKVLDVYKGKEIANGDSIKIYDLISYWMGDYVNYYGGLTPLNSDFEYIAFLKKAPRPNMKNTYIFSSAKYGHFNISVNTANVLFDYKQADLYIKEIMKYDYVELNCESSGYSYCENDGDDYIEMKKKLLEFFDINIT